MELLLSIATIILLLPGVILVLIPGVPGIFYMLLITLVFGFVDHFSRLSINEMLILAGIYVLSFFVDMLAGVVGAKYGGASFRSASLGVLGALVGTVLFPPLGGLAGLFIATLLSEWFRNKSERKALRAATYSLVGAFSGVLVNAFIALAFFVSFIIFVFFLN